MTLRILPQRLAICRLAAGAEIPSWTRSSAWLSITRTPSELSIVCDSAIVPDGVLQEAPWRAFEVQGPLDFSLTGVLAALAGILAQAEISLFAISTYDTDYILVRKANVADATTVLREAGHTVEPA